jgi:hypothetical protein
VIYSDELEIKDTTESDKSASYLDKKHTHTHKRKTKQKLRPRVTTGVVDKNPFLLKDPEPMTTICRLSSHRQWLKSGKIPERDVKQ